jgi:hypothetical protein
MAAYASFMPEPAQAAPQKTSGSFANLLASLTSKLQRDPWDDGTLPDDVVTITYEQALRAGRASQPATNQLLDGADHAKGEPFNAPVRGPQHSQLAKKLRTASITIRVTSEEQAQLHTRALAAQLSVSAYLRSCIFEAESLRTQVKEALAQMQLKSSQITSTTDSSQSSRNWRKRLFPAFFDIRRLLPSQPDKSGWLEAKS